MSLPKNKLLRKWLTAISYLYDIQVEVASSSLNPFIEVTYHNGKYVLNTKLANYSFASLHKVFQNVFKELKVKEGNYTNILVLGLGAGSIVSILRDEYKLDTPITAVELDPEILRLGKKYFGLNEYKNLNIIEQDAYDLVITCEEKFDLIAVDLFVDLDVPDKFASEEFNYHLNKLLMPKGLLIFNTVVNNKKQKAHSIEVSHNLPDHKEFIYEIAGGTNRVIYYYAK